MRLLRRYMPGQILIENAHDIIDADGLKKRMNLDGCGAVVSFLGITRSKNDDSNVIQLEFDAWLEKLPVVLNQIAEQATVSYTHLTLPTTSRV